MFRAVPVEIWAPPMDGNWKTTPTPLGNLGLWATTEPGFPEFFSTTVSGISSWLNVVFLYYPHGFMWKGENMKLILIHRSTAFMSFLTQKQCDCHLHCLLYSFIRPTIHVRKGATTANLSLLSSLPPPTSEIVIDKIPHPQEQCQ